MTEAPLSNPPHASVGPDALFAHFEDWVASQGISLYAHQSEAIVDALTGANVIITTPTGSGKSMVAIGGLFTCLAARGRGFYTAPIKALVSEKFFDLCDIFGADLVGMITGDASVNPDAPIICCTAEILANIALREGRDADVDLVIMDEFHFIADPDRGWAWQVSLSELPQAQFMIMLATLGDTTSLVATLEATTGRPTSVIADAARPVPLVFSWSMTPLVETIAELVATGQSPVYIVHPSQAAAIERAQALLSTPLADKTRRADIVEAIGAFEFSPGFGQTLATLLRAGIGVHHAGMLPKYRRLVERLAQQGLLAVICGTDTLGVGINVPIRTVLFTQLGKFDGRRARLLRAREFHQIAGRAGRPGFDPVGYVVVQAPEYAIENARTLAKFEGDEKKQRSVRRKKPPDGFVNYTEASFEKLVAAQPEDLHARLTITHAMLINLLHRDQETGEALVHIVDAATDSPAVRRSLLRRAVALGRSLLRSGVVTRRATPTAGGRRYDLAADLQDDFALNQPLSAFAMAAIELIDPESPDYALDVISVIEATLEDPMPVLFAQQFVARGEAVAELKADGYDYEERKEALEEVTWPRPLAELLEAAQERFASTHPWIRDHELSPKSIVRDMITRAMGFGEFVAFYKVQRSEGLVLRYLSDAYRALRQTVPAYARTDELDALITWLGQVVRHTDSSLVDEWEAMTGVVTPKDAPIAPPPSTRPLSANLPALRVLIRNAMWRRVELAARDDVDGLGALSGPEGITIDDWDDALGAYWDEHDEMLLDADARGPAMLDITAEGRTLIVRQIIADPEANHDWQIIGHVDLDATDESGELELTVTAMVRLGDV